MKNRVVSATEFKAKCLALLTELDDQGGTITITKRGRAMATVEPIRKKRWKSLKGAWIGRVHLTDEQLSPSPGMSATWEALQRE